MSAPDISSILAERRQTHGDFGAVARMYTQLCAAACLDPATMPPAAYTSISMSLMKVARARCGEPMLEEHARDVEGYARLWADACRAGAPE